jgi:hypothetical protein
MPDKYRKLLRQLDEYVFPFVSRSYDKRAAKKLHSLGFKESDIFLPSLVLHKLATWRFEHKFFAVPIEHTVIHKLLGNAE